MNTMVITKQPKNALSLNLFYTLKILRRRYQLLIVLQSIKESGTINKLTKINP